MNKVKIIYKDLPNKVVCTVDLTSNQNYDTIKQTIIEKSKGSQYKIVRVTSKDKFILKFEGINISGLNAIWNTDTYNFFLDKTQDNKEKIKFIIE